MSLVLATSVIVTAPASVDGRGEVATLNDSASGTFVGRVFKATGFGGAAVRTSMENRPEAHGSVFGNFYYAHRPFTLEVLMRPSTTWALSDARYNKLCRAFDAMADDGTIVFTDTDTIVKRISFRREQSPTDPDEQGHVILGGVCQDPRIYSNSSLPSGSPITNAGNAGSPPIFTLTPTASGTVVITNTTAGLGSPAVTLTIGPYVVAGTPVTVDFGARTIKQGSTYYPKAEVWPSSLWWELVPGANTYTVTNATSVSIAARSAWLSA